MFASPDSEQPQVPEPEPIHDHNTLMDGKRVMLLFDMDNTLTPASDLIWQSQIETLKKLKAKGYSLGIVTGADQIKLFDQIPENIRYLFDFLYSENGLVSYQVTGHGDISKQRRILDYLGQEDYDKLIEYLMEYCTNYDIPQKASMFVVPRIGTINMTPLGRECTREQREWFEPYDKENGVLSKMIAEVKAKFPHLEEKLQFAVGSQISVDIFPKGCDKRTCLAALLDKEEGGYEEIHFFGDKVFQGGNDFEIYHDDRVNHAYYIKGPQETQDILKELYLEKFAPAKKIDLRKSSHSEY